MKKAIPGPPVEPFGEILRRLERAARNGSRAHFEHGLVRAFMTSELFLKLNELRQAELTKQWEEDALRTPVAINSGNIGFGTGQIGTIGASAGSTGGPLAARASASEVARRMIRQKRPSRH